MASYLCKAFQLLLVVVTINQTYCWSTGRDLVFDKFGEYGFKQYFIPKNIKAQWHECKRLCEEYGMEFARLELSAEADYIFTTMKGYGSPAYFLHVDGTATTPGLKTGWYWTRSRYPIDYLSTAVWATAQPNNFQGDQFCLAIEKFVAAPTATPPVPAAGVGWNDVPCYANANAISTAGGPRPFLCQIKHENFIHRVINNQGGK